MSQQSTREASSLEELLAQINEEYHGQARILSGEEITTGGFLGIGARKSYQVTFEVPDVIFARTQRPRPARGVDTLLAAAEAMRPSRTPVVDKVVQVVGGMGDPRVQLQATRLLSLLAGATGADPVLMPAPSLLGTAAARESLVADPTVRSVMDLWSQLTVLLVGIGSVDPSPLLRESGNALPEAEQDALRAAGAVGDVCLRFFDANGAPVHTAVDDRLVGIDVDRIRAIGRRVAVAGGRRKLAAIRAALLGGWMNVLVTDVATAQALLED